MLTFFSLPINKLYICVSEIVTDQRPWLGREIEKRSPRQNLRNTASKTQSPIIGLQDTEIKLLRHGLIDKVSELRSCWEFEKQSPIHGLRDNESVTTFTKSLAQILSRCISFYERLFQYYYPYHNFGHQLNLNPDPHPNPKPNPSRQKWTIRLTGP